MKKNAWFTISCTKTLDSRICHASHAAPRYEACTSIKPTKGKDLKLQGCSSCDCLNKFKTQTKPIEQGIHMFFQLFEIILQDKHHEG